MQSTHQASLHLKCRARRGCIANCLLLHDASHCTTGLSPLPYKWICALLPYCWKGAIGAPELNLQIAIPFGMESCNLNSGIWNARGVGNKMPVQWCECPVSWDKDGLPPASAKPGKDGFTSAPASASEWVLRPASHPTVSLPRVQGR